MKDFIPPYPKPHKSKTSLIKRFKSGLNSWIHVLFEKSYRMKLGHVKLPKSDLYMPCQPDLVKRIMKKEYKNFPKHHLLGKLLKPLLGDSIFTTNGKVWERQRKMMNPAFTHTHLKKIFPLMDEAITEMLERFENKIKETDTLHHIDVEMTHITADIIFRTILSHPLKGKEAEEIFEAFNEFQDVSQKMMLMSVYCLPTFFHRRKSEKAAGRIKNILGKIIKRRYDDFQSKNRTKYDDILNSLLEAKDEETGEGFSYAELVDHVLMLFLAGHETSASALTWSLYLIASCEHVQNGMLREIDEVLKDSDLKFEQVKKLNLTHNVFQEALRLYPPVGFFLREAAKDTEMRGKEIKEGDMVMVSPWLIHRNKDQWQNADSFCPHRFSEDSEDSKSSIKTSYLPFGAGPRICIGAGFATQESIMVLAQLVRNFEFQTSPEHVPEPVGRITIRPKKGVWLQIRKRD